MKLSTHQPSPHFRKRGFTLIELLIVITIIATLAGLSFAAFSAVQGQAKKVQAGAMIAGIQTAITNYLNEYGKYPIPGGGKNARENVIDTEGAFLAILMGTDAGKRFNPRRIKFLNPKEARDGFNGVIMSGDNPESLNDPWGRPYKVVVDANYDERVRNPDEDSSDNQWVNQGSIVWSLGEDGDESNGSGISKWKDNPKSW